MGDLWFLPLLLPCQCEIHEACRGPPYLEYYPFGDRVTSSSQDSNQAKIPYGFLTTLLANAAPVDNRFETFYITTRIGYQTEELLHEVRTSTNRSSCVAAWNDFFRSNHALLPEGPADTGTGMPGNEGVVGGRVKALHSERT